MDFSLHKAKDMHEIFMRRCIQLARNGQGMVAPNPLVGAVIVYKGKIIGEGFHRKFGGPHAEVNAINSVKDKTLLRQSKLYVNLEPCSHYGKTPPCAKLIISCDIPEVIIGIQDPFPEVSGRGIKMLEEAGIKVISNILAEECRKLNKRFITFHTLKRPYLILKWAQSSDGYIDGIREQGKNVPQKISNSLTAILVHKMRAHESAILVGTNTVLLDNPQLNTRLWSGNNPVRLVIDRMLSIKEEKYVLNEKSPTIIFNALKNQEKGVLSYIKLDFRKDIIDQILNVAYEKGLQSIIVEGGAILLNSFIKKGLWDTVHLEISDKQFFRGLRSPVLYGIPEHSEKFRNSVIYTYIKQRIP